MALTKNTKIAAGIVVVIGAVVYLFRRNGDGDGGDVETDVILGDSGGQCVVITKYNVKIKKDKKLTWRIQQCKGKNELVTVGNFRLGEISTAGNCLQPTQGEDVYWPFKEDKDDLKKRQGTSKIELHIKKKSDPPVRELTYYFDICTGANAEHRSDPRLVIER